MTYTLSRSRTPRAGTVTHTPPEVLKDINVPLSVKYDVYSFAILFWELVTEDVAFKKGIKCTCFLSVSRVIESKRRWFC